MPREAGARDASDRAEALWRERRTAAENDSARLDAARARLASLEQRIAAEEGLAITLAARRRGGTRVGEGLDVEPALRSAVEAALGDAIRAAALGRDRVPGLRGERGLVVMSDVDVHRAAEREAERARSAAAALGGGALVDAVRRDPGGVASRLLATALWVPTLEHALEVGSALPPGWSVASRDGDLVTAAGLVALGGGGHLLERRAERDALAAEVENLSGVASEVRRASDDAQREAEAARAERDDARRGVEQARRDRRAADEAERAAGRAAEAAVRELAWERAQVDRLRDRGGPCLGRARGARAGERGGRRRWQPGVPGRAGRRGGGDLGSTGGRAATPA